LGEEWVLLVCWKQKDSNIDDWNTLKGPNLDADDIIDGAMSLF
jgi:hypothetical protein